MQVSCTGIDPVVGQNEIPFFWHGQNLLQRSALENSQPLCHPWPRELGLNVKKAKRARDYCMTLVKYPMMNRGIACAILGMRLSRKMASEKPDICNAIGAPAKREIENDNDDRPDRSGL